MSSSIVNVASVPQRSPFRYPGGKTWLVPKIRTWLGAMRPRELVEPFAGGGSVGLTAAAEGLADHVTLVELDADVAAVWQTMLGEDAEWLAGRILTFEPTPEAVGTILNGNGGQTRERAFRTLLRNRVARGGILAPGAGLVRRGENGRGLASRWYPETLARRVLAVNALADRITFIHGDGLEVMERLTDRPSVAFFVDPPYSASRKRAGSRLYAHAKLDHERLFRLAASAHGDVLLTYDNAPEVRDLAARHGLEHRAVPMKNTHHATMTELLIGQRLDWLESGNNQLGSDSESPPQKPEGRLIE